MEEIKLRQYSSAILDIFEDLLDQYDIDIPSDDRVGDEGEAHIYGSEYSELESQVTDVLSSLIEDYNKKIIVAVKIDKDNY